MRSKLLILTIALAAAACHAAPASAQYREDSGTGTLFQWAGGTGETGGPNLDEPIVTDRPDFTEASSTVGRGVAQLEMGYTYARDEDAGMVSQSHSYPESLLRVGILDDWLEARVAWNYSHLNETGLSRQGSEDLYVGAKIGLTPQDGFFPEMALMPQMTVPSGSDGISEEKVLPGVNWLYGWDLSDCISTGGSSQFNRAIDGTGDGYMEFAQSWTIGYGLTDRLGAYTEWFAFFPHDAVDAKPQHYFDGGFTYLITDDIQWDIRAGIGANDAADDFFVGSGLAIRFH